MKCRTCQYPLWNIRGRICPECGAGFKPSEFDFVPSTVRFCCPSCDQPYYGTDDRGHLVPRSFACVKCAQPLEMDTMVLLPTEGVDEARTKQDHLVWEQVGERSLWARFWVTCGQAMITPHRLGALLAREGSPGRATWFLFWSQSIALLGSVGVFFFFAAVMAGSGGGGGMVVLGMLAAFAGTIIVGFLLLLVYVLVWAALTHVFLQIGRKDTGATTSPGFGRTWSALCYAGGANVVSAIPCFGYYFGPFWWMIAAVFTIRGAHGVGGLRASIATLLPPLGALALVVGAYVAFFIAMLGGAGALGGGGAFGTTPATQWGTPAAHIGGGLDNWPTGVSTGFGVNASNIDQDSGLSGQNTFPPHALMLLVDGYVDSDDFGQPASAAAATIAADGDADDTASSPEEGEPVGWTVGDLTLDEFEELSGDAQMLILNDVMDAWPEGIVAHRVGDVVFTTHNVPARGMWNAPANDPDLWIAIFWPYTGSTDATGAYLPTALAAADIVVLKQGGAWLSESIAIENFENALQAQNELRGIYGLDPLPHPALVKDVAVGAEPD